MDVFSFSLTLMQMACGPKFVKDQYFLAGWSVNRVPVLCLARARTFRLPVRITLTLRFYCVVCSYDQGAWLATGSAGSLSCRKPCALDAH